ncbi:MAG: DUF5681 domain-containing protein [Parvibaculaceae bacterium]
MRHRVRQAATGADPRPGPVERASDLPAAEQNATAAASAGAAYEVGYGKPPVHSRFKPGRSGNPKGRPRDSKNVTTMLNQFLDERMTVRIGGVEKKMSGRQLILFRAVKDAIEGKKDARDFVLRMTGSAEREREAAAPPGLPDATAAELDLLQFFERQLLLDAGLPSDRIEAVLGGRSTMPDQAE